MAASTAPIRRDPVRRRPDASSPWWWAPIRRPPTH